MGFRKQTAAERESRVFAILGENPRLTPSRVCRLFKQAHGIGIDANATRKLMEKFRSVKPAVPKVAKVRRRAVAVLSPSVARGLIPAGLPEKVGRVRDAVERVGGYDRALVVAEAIEAVGGAGNFMEVLGFLRSMTSSEESLPPPTLASGAVKVREMLAQRAKAVGGD